MLPASPYPLKPVLLDASGLDLDATWATPGCDGNFRWPMGGVAIVDMLLMDRPMSGLSRLHWDGNRPRPAPV